MTVRTTEEEIAYLRALAAELASALSGIQFCDHGGDSDMGSCPECWVNPVFEKDHKGTCPIGNALAKARAADVL
jgi:hypothetical protein